MASICLREGENSFLATAEMERAYKEKNLSFGEDTIVVEIPEQVAGNLTILQSTRSELYRTIASMGLEAYLRELANRAPTDLTAARAGAFLRQYLTPNSAVGR